jgi:hypothetical protein
LLNWTLSDLAAASAFGLSTLKHFARRKTTAENLIAIRDAFEKAGTVFENDGKFVSVRLRIKHAAKAIARKRSSDIKSTRGWDEQLTAAGRQSAAAYVSRRFIPPKVRLALVAYSPAPDPALRSVLASGWLLSCLSQAVRRRSSSTAPAHEPFRRDSKSPTQTSTQ